MKTAMKAIRFFAATLPVSILFSYCKKDAAPSNNTIQQGNTTIEINSIYTGTPGGDSSRFLQVRYNNVIDAPINVTVTFYLKNGQQKNIPVAIAAGYKSWCFIINNETVPYGDYDLNCLSIRLIYRPNSNYFSRFP